MDESILKCWNRASLPDTGSIIISRQHRSPLLFQNPLALPVIVAAAILLLKIYLTSLLFSS